jgi:hypothetical protein
MNKNDNIFLNRLLNTPSVGLPRAKRVISDHYEASNEKKQMLRLGGKEQLRTRTEKAYGFSDNELPVEGAVSVPRTLDKLQEFMGISYKLPDCFLLDTA